MMTSVHFAFDGRIFYKEIKTLVKAGYDVVLIAPHDKEENIEGIRIIPLPKTTKRINRLVKTYFRLIWLALKERATIYHFHDPELIPLGLLLKLFNKIVIYDMHELVYFQFEYAYWIKNNLVKSFIQQLYLIIEKFAIIFLDHIILAEDDYRNYLINTYRNFDNYTTIRNFPLISEIETAEPIDGNLNRKFVLFYCGDLAEVRSISKVITSMEYLNGKAELWLLGKWESRAFEQKCKALPGWEYTRHLGAMKLFDI